MEVKEKKIFLGGRWSFLFSHIFLSLGVFFFSKRKKKSQGEKESVGKEKRRPPHGHGKTRKKNPETNESDPRSSGFFLVFRPCPFSANFFPHTIYFLPLRVKCRRKLCAKRKG
jgi:hypothetical protein